MMNKDIILNHFKTRDSYEENPYIKFGSYSNLKYDQCEQSAKRILSMLKDTVNPQQCLNMLNMLEALEYRMSDLRAS